MTTTTTDNNNNNKLNITADAAAAVKDVAESANAIRTAVEGVQKSMMNDPKSVEARTCCASILSVFHEHCDPTTTGVEDYSDQRLLVVVFVITVCGVVKSIIRHLHIRWLPEAGGCILVGVLGYLILQHMPHVRFAFDGDMFLRIMVPPIVFEAAVKINKQSFRRHVIPITIFAIVGTLASTAFTAFILHQGSLVFGHYVPIIPVKESLIFGALISSIDPIAVLSVLSSMGMTDTDTIYVLIFGESLLNDGVAIVLFQTLVHFLDESLVIDSEVMLDAFMHFVVVALGSVSVGMLSGACATLYFSLMHGCQTPMVEVIMFLCWSFVPYYICDMVEWSGIVAIVANGFVMDLYVIGQKHQQHHQHKATNSDVDEEIDYLVNGTVSSSSSNTRVRPYRQQKCRSIFTYEGHLSSKADIHVHFVIEIFATLMETAIFAYLGLFLFSPRYHWSLYLSLVSIFATVLGRVIMIPLFSQVANMLNRMNLSSGHHNQSHSTGSPLKANEGVHIDRRMQLVLVFAGLRGAMSFALVEHIPMFDTTTGQGSRLKPELKAMTSASIIFTLFVLGGSTSYLMERLSYSVKKQQGQDDVEIVSLLSQHDDKMSPLAKMRDIPQASDASLRSNGSVRQRGFNLSR
jgi:NhaP-type Na+/H+ or K+/H+ antiporter